jgi:hypothetical protein
MLFKQSSWKNIRQKKYIGALLLAGMAFCISTPDARATVARAHGGYGPTANPGDSIASPSAPTINVTEDSQAPSVSAEQRYINPTFLKTHTADTFDSSGGDVLVLYASSHRDVVFTPSDNFGNLWISIAGPTSTATGFDLRSEVWYVANPKVGPGHFITMKLSSAQPLVMSVFVVKGADRSAPIDAVSLIRSDPKPKGRGVSNPAVATARSNELLLAWTKVSWGAHAEPGFGFKSEPTASSNFLYAESAVVSAPGDYHSVFTLGTREAWQSAVVAISADPNRATISWTAATDEKSAKLEYLIERCEGRDCTNFEQVGRTFGTTFHDAGLSSSQSYSYRVRARRPNSRFGPYSGVASIMVPADRPSLPTGVTAAAAGLREILLSWIPSPENHAATGKYLVERCSGDSCSEFKAIGTVAGTSFRDRDVVPWNVYRYQVRAVSVNRSTGPALSAVCQGSLAGPHARYIAFVFVLCAAPLFSQTRRAKAARRLTLQ